MKAKALAARRTSNPLTPHPVGPGQTRNAAHTAIARPDGACLPRGTYPGQPIHRITNHDHDHFHDHRRDTRMSTTTTTSTVPATNEERLLARIQHLERRINDIAYRRTG